MKAIWKNVVIAEAEKSELIRIEGNWYFPPDALHREYFNPSQTQTTCHWKGEASYYNIIVGRDQNPDAAWYYSKPKDGSIERVGKDYANYVAFWHGVEVAE